MMKEQQASDTRKDSVIGEASKSSRKNLFNESICMHHIDDQ